MRRSAFVGLWFLAASLGQAATWHVATDGNDGNAGDASAPFATLARAEVAAAPGDEILLHDGRYHLGRAGLRVETSGEPGRPIVVRAKNPGRVVLTTAWPLEKFEPYKGRLFRALLDRPPNMAAQDGDPLHNRWDLPFTGPDDPKIRRGCWHWHKGYFYVWPWDDQDPNQHRITVSFRWIIEIDGSCSHRVWEGLIFEHCNYGLGWKSRDARHHTVRNCLFKTGCQGIGGAPDTLIEHCTFYNLGPSTWEHGIYDDHENTVIRYCHFERIAGGGVHLYKAPTAATVSYNTFGPPMTDRVSTPGGGQVGIYAFGRGHRIHHNVIYGGHRIGIDLAASDCLFANNTSVGTTVAALLVAGAQQGTRVEHNVLAAAGGWAAELRTRPAAMDGNLYSAPGQWQLPGRTLPTLAEWQEASGFDAAGAWLEKLLFVDATHADYRIAPGTLTMPVQPGAFETGKPWPEPTGVSFPWKP